MAAAVLPLRGSPLCPHPTADAPQKRSSSAQLFPGHDRNAAQLGRRCHVSDRLRDLSRRGPPRARPAVASEAQPAEESGANADVAPNPPPPSRRAFLGLTAAGPVATLSRAATAAAAPPLAPAAEAPPAAPSGYSPSELATCPDGCAVTLTILGGSVLGVSVYPDFAYNPVGGRGRGTAVECGDGRRVRVKFDAESLYIPAVRGDTTSLLGVPLPPPILIDIVPQALEGYIERDTGKVELNFLAKFFFSAGPLYRAPPLLVDTVLTTDVSQGVTRSGRGVRMDAEGRCRLVGTARVPPVDDLFLTRFLMLPADVLAELPAQLRLVPPAAGGRPAAGGAPEKDGALLRAAALATALENGQFDLVHQLQA